MARTWQISLLDANEADMALVPLPVPDRFTTTFVADEEIVLAASSGHRLARQSTVRMQEHEIAPDPAAG